MSTSNSSPMGQTFDPQAAAELRDKRKKTIENSLAKRHRKEKTFRIFGLAAVISGLFFVVLLFGSILAKGLPAFWQTSLSVPVYLIQALLMPDLNLFKVQVNLQRITKSVMSLGKPRWAWWIGMHSS